MRIIPWVERQAGDLFLVAGSNALSIGIKMAEGWLHPEYDQHQFVPTHAGIIGMDDTVIEAMLSKTENSVCAVNPASEYAAQVGANEIEVWRPFDIADDTPMIVRAISMYVADYTPKGYGWPDLLGFEYRALIKHLTGWSVENPLSISDVCSQGALLYLGKYLAPEFAPELTWAASMANDTATVRDCDPLALRIALLAHQDPPVPVKAAA